MTLKERTRETILNALKENETDAWRVLVVDSLTVKVLSSVMSLAEVMEENISLIENLEIGRQPMPEFDVIYFISPTESSVNMMLKDFENLRKPKYRRVNIAFSSQADDFIMSEIKQSAIVSRVTSLKELNVEFRAFESQAFSVELPSAFKNLYSPSSSSSAQTALNAEYRNISKRLLTLCLTLNEMPVIRYPRSNKHAQMVANKLSDDLDTFSRMPQTGFTPNRDNQATLLILDRSSDPLAPLIHEFTYQAMACDLLDIRNGRYKHSVTKGDGKKEEKEMLLSEADKVWCDLRHLFIADASEKVSEEFKEFMARNKMAQHAKGSGGDDLAAMSDALRQMPQYRELLERYSLHLGIAQSCMQKHGQSSLEDAATLEQNMAMGEDPNGNSFTGATSHLTTILRGHGLNETDKLRLLLIYVITQGGLSDSERRKLIELARISPSAEQTILNMQHLGISLVKKNKARLFKRSKGPKRRRAADGALWDLFRFRPNVFFLGQDIVDDKLAREDYPPINDRIASHKGVSVNVAGSGQSARKTAKPGWSLKSGGKPAAQESKPAFSGARIIIFIVGGMTYSEMRSAYELSKSCSREVLVGSTHVITPVEYVSDLSALEQAPSA